MLIKTKDFKNAAKSIVLASSLDKNATNLELNAKNNTLYLNVTNREYFVSVKFALESSEEFRAVVDAPLFLNLIAGITTETVDLSIKSNVVHVKAGKSNYKVPMIYENTDIMTLPVITIQNKTVEMPISIDILRSISEVNSKEIDKGAKLDINELQKLYYIDETGCFTFTTSACLNKFTLEKPVKMLLNDRIVKLFKLFNEDVNFTFGNDVLPDGTIQSKIILQSDNIYVAAIILSDDTLIKKVQVPCEATKRFINTDYTNKLVVSTSKLNDAIKRLMLFTKNSVDSADMANMPAKLTFVGNDIIIKDFQDNQEVVEIESGSTIEEGYALGINLADIKLVLDSCKEQTITFNCGNHRSVVMNRGNISNLIPEGKM